MASSRKFISLAAKLTMLALLAGTFGSLAQDGKGKGTALPAVVSANNQFSIDFYKNASATEPGMNIFVSPVSVSTALAMTFEGSRNETRAQMAKTLHFNMTDAERMSGFAALMKETKAGPEKHYALDIANALWEDKGMRLQPDYMNTMNKFYGGNINEVSFSTDPGGSIRTINKWVEDKTAGKIKDLIHPDNIDALTKLVLTNAIYFKGDWEFKFKEGATKDADFHMGGGTNVKAHMMRQIAHFRYAHEYGMAAIELPYLDNDLSMIAILPDGDIEAMGAGLSLDQITKLRAAMHSTEVDVSLPRFKFETRYLLEDMLAKLGMPDAFSEGKADFSGMTGGKDLYILHVIHQGYIDVNEKGSEAAAATAVVMDGKSVNLDMPEVFRADRPFLFMIVHNSTGSILFMGRLSNPVS